VHKSNLNVGFWFTRVERGIILANKLQHKGASVTFYHNQSIPKPKISVRHVPYNIFSGLKILFESKQDIYFSTGLLLPSLQLTMLKVIRKTPFIIGVGAPYWRTYNTSHNFLINWILKTMIYHNVFRLIMHNAKHIVTNSIYLQQLMRVKYPSIAHKIVNVYNGADYTKFNDSYEIATASIDASFRIITVGTANFKAKTDGLIFLIKAVSQYLQNAPNITFTVVAKSVVKYEQDRLLNSIPDATRNRIEVIFNSDQVASIMGKSNLFIYSTPSESSDSLPRVLIEAQAIGIPTITTNTVGCPEVVINGKTGIVVDSDSDQIVKAIQFCVDNSTLATERATLGKRNVRQKFNWDCMAKEYMELISSSELRD
jgi:glycosyltransferase involved in cell wall biosynthesis